MEIAIIDLLSSVNIVGTLQNIYFLFNFGANLNDLKLKSLRT